MNMFSAINGRSLFSIKWTKHRSDCQTESLVIHRHTNMAAIRIHCTYFEDILPWPKKRNGEGRKQYVITKTKTHLLSSQATESCAETKTNYCELTRFIVAHHNEWYDKPMRGLLRERSLYPSNAHDFFKDGAPLYRFELQLHYITARAGVSSCLATGHFFSHTPRWFYQRWWSM